MSRRNNRPALYELSQGSVGSSERGLAPGRGTADEPPSEGSRLLMPGTGVRLPGGVLVAAILVVMLLIGGGWWLGFQQGVARTESLMAARPGQIPVDPMIASVMREPGEDLSPDTPSTPSASENRASDPDPEAWYFILAETSTAGAQRLAAFCRAQGLEVRVVPRHNTELARIVAMPGMASSSRQNDQVRAMDDRIDVIGRRWKNSGGRTDFSDRYLDRIFPPSSAD